MTDHLETLRHMRNKPVLYGFGTIHVERLDAVFGEGGE